MRYTLAAVLIAALAACAATPPDDRTAGDEGETATRALPGPSERGGSGALAEQELCDAADYRVFVGTKVDDASIQEGPELRVFGANDIVTQDYIPQRTNVVHGPSREILRVYCG